MKFFRGGFIQSHSDVEFSLADFADKCIKKKSAKSARENYIITFLYCELRKKLQHRFQ
jgi:hypothetical protein